MKPLVLPDPVLPAPVVSAPLPGRRVAVVAALALVAVASVRLGISGRGWHHEDDVRSLRWVMEYRDRPWAALTELHSLHDHVRPATLIATWAGAQLSNGSWWGVHAVALLLAALALGAVVVLGKRWSDSVWGGLAAGALVVALPGFGSLPTWNAWICSGGELACGLWGLVALDRSLSGRRAPWLAVLLLIVAGLFKEPGWLVYPAAAAVMAISAWRRGRSGASAAEPSHAAAPRVRRPLAHPLAALVVLPIGVTGLWLTWNATNVFRAEVATLPWGQRLVAFLGSAVVDNIDRWPLGAADPTAAGVGVPLLLVALGLVSQILSPRRPADNQTQSESVGSTSAVLMGLALSLWLGAMLLPGWVSAALVLATAAIGLVLRPRPQLVLLLLPFAIMAPFQQPNDVQVLAGGVGLALVAATGAVTLGRRAPRWAPPLLAALLLAPTVRLLVRERGLAARALPGGEQASHASFVGLGGVAARLGAHQVATDGRLDALILVPLLGLELVDAPPTWPVAVELPGPVWLPASRWPVDWKEDDLLPSLPPLLGARKLKVRPGGHARQRPSVDGLLLDLAPGAYLLGLAPRLQADADRIMLEARDRCGHTWALHGPVLAEAAASAVVVPLTKDCAPLSVTRARAELPGRPFLIPIDDVTEDLRAAVVGRRRVDVGAAAGGVVDGLLPDASLGR